MTGLQPIAELVFGRAVNSLLIGTLLAGVLWALLRRFGRLGSSVRFAISFAALLAIAAVFLYGGVASHATGALSTHSGIAIPSRWALYVFMAWAAGAVVGISRIGAGLWGLQQLRRGSLPIGDGHSAFQPADPNSASGRRRAVVCVSKEVRVPTAIGFFHPIILLPAWALQGLSPEQLHAVVLHEKAHLDRWDDWTNLAQKLLRAFLFFHPAVWWIDHRLMAEREIACDDLVLARATSPRHYAQCLVSVAERSFLRRPLDLAQAAVGRIRLTAQRVTRILDGRERRVEPVWKPALAALMVFSVVGFLAIERMPQMVTFTENPEAVGPLAADEVLHATVAAPSEHSTQVAYAVKQHKPAKLLRRAVTPSAVPEGKEVATGANILDLQPGAPMVINARAIEAAQPHVVFVIFQTQQYDSSGGLIVTTSVWRFKVKPAQSAIVIRARST